MKSLSLLSTRPDVPGLVLIAVLAAGCTFDASQLRALPDAGGSGAGGTTSPTDAATAVGGSGGVAKTGGGGGMGGASGVGGIGGSSGLGGSGGRGDAGVPDAPATQPDVPIGGSGGGAGGVSGVGGTGGGSTISVGGTTSSSGGIIVSLGGATSSTGAADSGAGGSRGSGGTSASSTAPQSCSGLAATCGPLGNESCCTSLLVQGGVFDRSYDDLDFTDPNYPATVNDFYLDKYEITVGRFRAFLNAGMGTQANPPASGAGAHPLLAGSGWDSAWNTNLPKDTTSLRQAMDDCGGNWTDRALSNESQPQNCLDWYTAFAFCAWDGGSLPTEAEWNYAASGGKEQRYYPWSNPPTSTTIDDTYAVYCGGSCSGTQNVGSRSPKGDGKWGQSDLGGNIGEWTLDWYAEPYSMPCDNCAYLTEAGSCPVARGGVFDEGAPHLRSTVRGVSSLCAKGRYFTLGARCARTSYGTGTGTGDAGVPDAPSAQPDVPMGGAGGGAGGISGVGGAGGGTTGPTGGGTGNDHVEARDDDRERRGPEMFQLLGTRDAVWSGDRGQRDRFPAPRRDRLQSVLHSGRES